MKELLPIVLCFPSGVHPLISPDFYLAFPIFLFEWSRVCFALTPKGEVLPGSRNQIKSQRKAPHCTAHLK